MNNEFFPPRPEIKPTIYAYKDTHPQYKGLLKIGYTTRDAKTRVAEQYPVIRPGESPYKILLEESAVYSAIHKNGSAFSDHDVHRYLRKQGFKNPDGEWFQCTSKDVKAAILAIKNGAENVENRTLDFGMRPEQQEAVDKA
ncbi:MAG: GIY-YIG nuclease family protein, partial [Pseudanabaena sp. M110S1SP2A07QC]|nr:GIY-YIG nuclease family protein [Pseudanabaena sp. M110S1SP2A07QC]